MGDCGLYLCYALNSNFQNKKKENQENLTHLKTFENPGLTGPL